MPAGFPITQEYGEAKDVYGPQGYALGHPGLDFACPVGTPVLAAADGRVAHAGYDPVWPGRGLWVCLDHGRYATYYLHLSDVQVQVGRTVKAGQVIGLSGNTGLSTGPHLHWGVQDDEAMDNGSRGFIDPLLVLLGGRP